jgi:nucleoside-diphosphate-sugar epimerase
LIYGQGLGLHPDSVQLPALAEQARRSGIARTIGRGLNIWSHAHVEDVADLYLLALDKAPAGSFYFVENGEASFRDMAAGIASALRLGPAQSWTVNEAIAVWGYQRAVFSLGSNCRVRAGRARRELGWRPQHASVTGWISESLTAAR